MKNLIIFTFTVGLFLSLDSEACSTKVKGEVTGHALTSKVQKKKLTHLEQLRQSLQNNYGVTALVR